MDPHPDNPDVGTAREDKFYAHSIAPPDPQRKDQPGMTKARPGTLSGGTSEVPTSPIDPDSDDDELPHDMSSDLHNHQNDPHTNTAAQPNEQ